MNARNRTPLVIAGVLAVVLIVGLVVVLATGGDDGDDDEATADDGTVATQPAGGDETSDPSLPEALQGELRPLTVEGAALPEFAGGEDPAVGQRAPVLTGEGFDGQAITTAPDGGPVMIVTLAHWCPHCNNEIPRLIELNDAGRLPESLRVVGLSTSVAADQPNFPPSEWIVDKEWPWEIMADYLDFDTDAYIGAGALGVSAFPFVTIVDADGNVVVRWSGESDIDDLEAKIADAVGT
jgi:cytochrome c biogenesis protein CcmG, thiol:disulfide interchange protein DsbE